MNPEEQDRLNQLLDRYFEDRLDDALLEELDAQLCDSEIARKQFWKRAGLEESLESWGRRQNGEVSAVTNQRAGGGPRKWQDRIPQMSGWAAAVAILITWFIQSRGQPHAPNLPDGSGPVVKLDLPEAGNLPVALLSRLDRVEAEVSYYRGQSLGAGKEVSIADGLMELDFFSGARVTIQGPARFVPVSDLQIEVLDGKVMADVPESAIGFKMQLPDGIVTDFGTKFEVVVKDAVTSRVQVSEGEIELEGRESRRRMTTGQAVSLAGADDISAIDFVPMSFAETLDRLSAEDRQSRTARWMLASQVIDTDPRVIAHFSLTPEEDGSRVILNHSKNSQQPSSATVIAANWTEGRWPGKVGLGFRRPTDQVRMDIPGVFPEASFLAWVRVDGLPRQYNGLFFSEFGIGGEVHWQISKEGAFYFGVRPEGSPTISRFHRAFTDPVISPSDIGRWKMLATTYDAENREVVHYVNGLEVGRTSLDQSVPLRFGRATLGNFLDPTPAAHQNQDGLGEEWSFRNWTGVIDEFILFSRILQADEVMELYEAGRID